MTNSDPMRPLAVQYSATLVKREQEFSGDLCINTQQDEKHVVDLIRFDDPITAGEELHTLLTDRQSHWVRDQIAQRDEDGKLEDYNIDREGVDLTVESIPPEAVYVAACLAADDSHRYTVAQRLLAWVAEDAAEFEAFEEFQWTCRVVLNEVFIDDSAAAPPASSLTGDDVPDAIR